MQLGRVRTPPAPDAPHSSSLVGSGVQDPSLATSGSSDGTSASSNSSARMITLGDHIDAIIISDYSSCGSSREGEAVGVPNLLSQINSTSTPCSGKQALTCALLISVACVGCLVTRNGHMILWCMKPWRSFRKDMAEMFLSKWNEVLSQRWLKIPIYIFFLISTLSLTVQSTPTFTTSEVTSISTRASPIVRPSSDTSVGSSSDAHRSRNFSGNVHSPGASAPQTQSQPHHDVHHNWRKRVQQQALSVRLFLFFLCFVFFPSLIYRYY